MRRIPAPGLSLLLGTLAGLACLGPDDPTDRRVDLLPGSSVSNAWAEVGEIEFPKTAHERLLIAGWGPASQGIRWSEGPASALRFYLDRPRELEASLEAFALEYPEAPGQEVRVLLNGTEVARFDLEPRVELQTVRFTLPTERLDRDNLLVFHYSHPRRPVDVIAGSPDVRELAVAWRSLRFEGVATRRFPEIEETSILLGPGSAVDVALPPGPSGRFVLEDVEVVGSGAGDPRGRDRGRSASPPPLLRIEVREDPVGGGDAKEHRIAESGPVELRVPGQRGALVRLSVPIIVGAPADGRSVRVLRPHWRLDPPSATPDTPRPIREPNNPKPNVIVYLVDTLRADVVGAYRDGETTPPSATPRIDAFAAEATLFERARASAAWTRATVASLLTGMDADVHRTLRRDQGLSLAAEPLPAILRAAGYRTGAVFTNSNASPMTGFDRGFDRTEHFPELPTPQIHQPAELVTDLALRWLDEDSEGPFLLYLHVTDPHDPYLPLARDKERLGLPEMPPDLGSGPMMRRLERGEVEPSPHLRDRLLDLYRGDVLRTDRAFGGLIDGLKARGLWDSALIVFVSDHGEEFYDHGGWTHGRTLFSEMLAVPLILKFPSGRGRGERVDSLVRQIDVLPTILDLAGVPGPPGIQGRSLASSWARTLPERPAHGYLDFGDGRIRSVELDGLKLILSEDPRGTLRSLELFGHSGLREDTENLLLGHDPSALRKATYLEGLVRGKPGFDPQPLEPGPTESTDEIEERLRALGYL